MSLSERDRERYARHLLLAQLGEAGQERLLAASVCADGDSDEGALAVARTYLERAGVRFATQDSVAGGSTQALALASRAEVERIAGTPELEPAARALLGALAAVRAIQDAAGLPASTLRLQNFVISSEEA